MILQICVRRASKGDGPFHERIGFPTQASSERTVACIIPPGFTRQGFWTCAKGFTERPRNLDTSGRRSLALYKSVVVTLALRRNRTQAELAETYGGSQP